MEAPDESTIATAVILTREGLTITETDRKIFGSTDLTSTYG